MKRRVCSIVLIGMSIILLTSAYAPAGVMRGSYGVTGHSGMQEIYGQYLQSQSYCRAGQSENYGPGYLEEFWGWHLRSEAWVQNEIIVNASSQTPAPVGAWMEMGSIWFDFMSEPAAAVGWTNTQSVYSPSVDQSVDIELFHTAEFYEVPAGFNGHVKIYFGIWRNTVSADNLVLDERESWTFADLSFHGQTYRLLERTFSSDSDSSTLWSLDLEAGNDYRFFTYMVGEVVPEPATLLLLAAGTYLIRGRKN